MFLRLGASTLALVAVVAVLLTSAGAQQTLKLSSTLTLEKDVDKEKTYEQVTGLLNHAKEKKLERHVVIFLENTVQQLQKVLETAKVLAEMKSKEVPKDFTPAKYRVKPIPKLGAKKITTKKISAKDLAQRIKEGKSLQFDVPMLVTNATALFQGDSWNDLRRHWSAGRIAASEELEKSLRLEYWPPDKAKARMIGNFLQYEEPNNIAFSQYLAICHFGSPAKPKLPGQNTDHCEQVVDAKKMVVNSSELQALEIFPELKNALPMMADFKHRLLEAGKDEIPLIFGKGADKWIKNTAHTQHQFFTFGPSGSGDKLHAENGLPFFDILIHGSRRWLLLKDEEMQSVAKKAKEALEFDKTSAYMFFEEKLPELKEEFGLKKYVEANQNAGDMVIVPSGWYRVSLSLADSISYYETLLTEKETLATVVDNNIWRPQFRNFQLAFCYDPDEVRSLPGKADFGEDFYQWIEQALKQVKLEEAIQGVMQVLFTCASVLGMESSFPSFQISTMSTCTPAIYKKCRKQLATKLAEKGVKATLDWLPKEAPKSTADISKAKQEL